MNENVKRLKIVSKDGIGLNTQVLLDGVPLPGVTCIQINDIRGNGPVSAVLHFDQVDLDLDQVKQVDAEVDAEASLNES